MSGNDFISQEEIEELLDGTPENNQEPINVEQPEEPKDIEWVSMDKYLDILKGYVERANTRLEKANKELKNPEVDKPEFLTEKMKLNKVVEESTFVIESTKKSIEECLSKVISATEKLLARRVSGIGKIEERAIKIDEEVNELNEKINDLNLAFNTLSDEEKDELDEALSMREKLTKEKEDIPNKIKALIEANLESLKYIDDLKAKYAEFITPSQQVDAPVLDAPESAESQEVEPSTNAIEEVVAPEQVEQSMNVPADANVPTEGQQQVVAGPVEGRNQVNSPAFNKIDLKEYMKADEAMRYVMIDKATPEQVEDLAQQISGMSTWAKLTNNLGKNALDKGNYSRIMKRLKELEKGKGKDEGLMQKYIALSSEQGVATSTSAVADSKMARSGLDISDENSPDNRYQKKFDELSQKAPETLSDNEKEYIRIYSEKDKYLDYRNKAQKFAKLNDAKKVGIVDKLKSVFSKTRTLPSAEIQSNEDVRLENIRSFREELQVDAQSFRESHQDHRELTPIQRDDDQTRQP